MNAKNPLILVINQFINPATALMVDGTIFTCPVGAEFEVVEVSEVHTVLGTDGGAVTADLKKCTGTQAPASGTSVLASTFDLKSTINTPIVKSVGLPTPTTGLSTNKGTRTLKAGERLCLDLTGVQTALAGFCMTISLDPGRPATSR